ncbi:helix-turn-helix domain-containing protein [Antarctobacter heliothermus]|uniref:DNA-binding transcriptional regulator, XRE-family HTH domain n=1 Tax=Antarctobacter heliothermus TaxID=74033 RepID=A0A239JLI8_9RHOB|nr:helix-turn-helix transcriptional regulator [Antarctobacter heliothermus]SNT06173.1 DNA-binding transcriptional regulator, XRE-family HTH domain [Antarctobacter heliothermus]
MSIENERKLLADVGRRIRAIRAEQSLNLDQLARLTGISAPALSLIETGKRDARLTTLAKIAAALRVSLSVLMDDTSPGPDAKTKDAPQGYDLGDYL